MFKIRQSAIVPPQDGAGNTSWQTDCSALITAARQRSLAHASCLLHSAYLSGRRSSRYPPFDRKAGVVIKSGRLVGGRRRRRRGRLHAEADSFYRNKAGMSSLTHNYTLFSVIATLYNEEMRLISPRSRQWSNKTIKAFKCSIMDFEWVQMSDDWHTVQKCSHNHSFTFNTYLLFYDIILWSLSNKFLM